MTQPKEGTPAKSAEGTSVQFRVLMILIGIGVAALVLRAAGIL